MFVVDFDVTYGDAMAAVGYSRCVRSDGMGADVNIGGRSAFLWCKRDKTGDPVTGITVVTSAADAPAGYRVLEKALTEDSAPRLLAFQCDPGENPVEGVVVLYGDETKDEDGWEKVDVALGGEDSNQAFLWLKRGDRSTVEGDSGAGAGEAKWHAESLQLHDDVDVQDGALKWRIGYVYQRRATAAVIAFRGFGPSHDVVVPFASGRLAPLGTHTSPSSLPGAPCNLTAEEIDALRETLAVAADDAAPDKLRREAWTTVRTEVLRVLRCALTEPGAADAALRLLGPVADEAVRRVRGPRPVDVAPAAAADGSVSAADRAKAEAAADVDADTVAVLAALLHADPVTGWLYEHEGPLAPARATARDERFDAADDDIIDDAAIDVDMIDASAAPCAQADKEDEEDDAAIAAALQEPLEVGASPHAVSRVATAEADGDWVVDGCVLVRTGAGASSGVWRARVLAHFLRIGGLDAILCRLRARPAGSDDAGADAEACPVTASTAAHLVNALCGTRDSLTQSFLADVARQTAEAVLAFVGGLGAASARGEDCSWAARRLADGAGTLLSAAGCAAEEEASVVERARLVLALEQIRRGTMAVALAGVATLAEAADMYRLPTAVVGEWEDEEEEAATAAAEAKRDTMWGMGEFAYIGTSRVSVASLSRAKREVYDTMRSMGQSATKAMQTALATKTPEDDDVGDQGSGASEETTRVAIRGIRRGRQTNSDGTLRFAQAFTLETFADWLASSGTADVILSPKSHVQILSSATPLFTALACAGKLTVDLIIDIWRASLGEHDARNVALLKLLRLLASWLDAEALQAAATAIDAATTIGLAFTEEHITTLLRITLTCAKQTAVKVLSALEDARGEAEVANAAAVDSVLPLLDGIPTQTVALPLLWRIMISDQASPDLRIAARDAAAQCLGHPTLSPALPDYLRRCGECVREGASVALALQLVEALLDEAPASSAERLNQLHLTRGEVVQLAKQIEPLSSGVMDGLSASVSALRMVDATRRRDAARVAGQTAGKAAGLCAGPTAAAAAAAGGNAQWHAAMENVHARLRFIGRYHAAQEAPLGVEEMEVLWELFVAGKEEAEAEAADVAAADKLDPSSESDSEDKESSEAVQARAEARALRESKHETPFLFFSFVSDVVPVSPMHAFDVISRPAATHLLESLLPDYLAHSAGRLHTSGAVAISALVRAFGLVDGTMRAAAVPDRLSRNAAEVAGENTLWWAVLLGTNHEFDVLSELLVRLNTIITENVDATPVVSSFAVSALKSADECAKSADAVCAAHDTVRCPWSVPPFKRLRWTTALERVALLLLKGRETLRGADSEEHELAARVHENGRSTLITFRAQRRSSIGMVREKFGEHLRLNARCVRLSADGRSLTPNMNDESFLEWATAGEFDCHIVGYNVPLEEEAPFKPRGRPFHPESDMEDALCGVWEHRMQLLRFCDWPESVVSRAFSTLLDDLPFSAAAARAMCSLDGSVPREHVVSLLGALHTTSLAAGPQCEGDGGNGLSWRSLIDSSGPVSLSRSMALLASVAVGEVATSMLDGTDDVDDAADDVRKVTEAAPDTDARQAWRKAFAHAGGLELMVSLVIEAASEARLGSFLKDDLTITGLCGILHAITRLASERSVEEQAALLSPSLTTAIVSILDATVSRSLLKDSAALGHHVQALFTRQEAAQEAKHRAAMAPKSPNGGRVIVVNGISLRLPGRAGDVDSDEEEEAAASAGPDADANAAEAEAEAQRKEEAAEAAQLSDTSDLVHTPIALLVRVAWTALAVVCAAAPAENVSALRALPAWTGEGGRDSLVVRGLLLPVCPELRRETARGAHNFGAHFLAGLSTGADEDEEENENVNVNEEEEEAAAVAAPSDAEEVPQPIDATAEKDAGEQGRQSPFTLAAIARPSICPALPLPVDADVAGSVGPHEDVAADLLHHLNTAYAAPDRCGPFFGLLRALLRSAGKGLAGEGETLLPWITAKLAKHRTKEETPAQSDHALRGLLAAAATLVRGSGPEAAVAFGAGCESPRWGLLGLVFHDGLFAEPTAEARLRDLPPAPMCKHPATRRQAFQLLLALARAAPDNTRLLCSWCERHHTASTAASTTLAMTVDDAEDTETPGDDDADAGMSADAEAALVLRHTPTLVASVQAIDAGKLTASDVPGLTRAAVQLARCAAEDRFATGGRSGSGYAGLINLGAVCYMNSSLQQFFLVPAFRRRVLAVSDYSEAERLHGRKEDSVVFQLQRLFAGLQDGERCAQSPRDLCAVFKDWDGQPVNPFEQRDASEFLGQFFQHLDNELGGTAFEDVSRSVFGGSMVQVLSGESVVTPGLRFRSVRRDPSSLLSVDVQGLPSLEASLARTIRGGTVDFTWDNPDSEGGRESVQTTRRVCMEDLPDHLILHLKRFEFDYQRGEQVKINDRFEFPDDLDMFPYTLQGIQAAEGADNADDSESTPAHGPDYYRYRLRGVVVHSGTASGGHYYSYVQEREPRGSAATVDFEGRWFELNDSYVGPFDPAHLEAECFGGSAPGSTRQRYGSAFLLMYDRVQPLESTDAGEAETTAETAVEKTEDSDAPTVPVDTSSLSAEEQIRLLGMPPALSAEVWSQNRVFWRRRSRQEPEYFRFLGRLLDVATLGAGASGGAGAMSALRLGVSFVTNSLSATGKSGPVAAWTRRIRSLISSSPDAALWFASSLTGGRKPDDACRRSLLFKSSPPVTRSAMASMILATVHELARAEGGGGELSFPAGARYSATTLVVGAFLSGDGARLLDAAVERATTGRAAAAEAHAEALMDGDLEAAAEAEADLEAAKANLADLATFPAVVDELKAYTPLRRLVDVLLALLPCTPHHITACAQYFDLLHRLVSAYPASSPLRQYLRASGLLPALVDLAAGPRSSMPRSRRAGALRSDVMRRLAGTGSIVGTAGSTASAGGSAFTGRASVVVRGVDRQSLLKDSGSDSWNPLLSLLAALATDCEAPTDAADAEPQTAAEAATAAPQPVRAAVDLTSLEERAESGNALLPPVARLFFDDVLIKMLCTAAATDRVSPRKQPVPSLEIFFALYEHLCRGGTARFTAFSASVSTCLQSAGYAQQAPMIRGLLRVARAAGADDVPSRVATAVTDTLVATEGVAVYFRATLRVLEVLAREAARDAAVCDALVAFPNGVAWAVQWLGKNRAPPDPYVSSYYTARKVMTLHKPRHGYALTNAGWQRLRSTLTRVRKVVHRAWRRLAATDAAAQPPYNSESEEAELVGSLVRFLRARKLHDGIVTSLTGLSLSVNVLVLTSGPDHGEEIPVDVPRLEVLRTPEEVKESGGVEAFQAYYAAAGIEGNAMRDDADFSDTDEDEDVLGVRKILDPESIAAAEPRAPVQLPTVLDGDGDLSTDSDEGNVGGNDSVTGVSDHPEGDNDADDVYRSVDV